MESVDFATHTKWKMNGTFCHNVHGGAYVETGCTTLAYMKLIPSWLRIRMMVVDGLDLYFNYQHLLSRRINDNIVLNKANRNYNVCYDLHTDLL